MSKQVLLATLFVSFAVPQLASAQKFDPKKKLRGKRVRPEGSGTSFVVPKGWRHGYTSDTEYQLAPKKHANKAVITMTRKMLSAAEREMSMTEGLRSVAEELLEGVPAQVVAGPSTHTIGGKPAGRLIVKASVNGVEAEGYLAIVVDGTWAYIITGVYEGSLAKEVRAGADTILATFTAKSPKPNRRLMSKMIGCWSRFYRSTGGGGSGNTQSSYVFNRDGTWSWSYYLSISVPGMTSSDKDKDGGTWTAFGDTLYLQSNVKGEDKQLLVEKKGAFTYLGNIKYLPCS